jgi:lia operon protein LiaG
MRKSAGIILISAGVLMILFTLGSGNIFANNWFSFGTKQINIERSIDAADFQNLAIETRSTDVQVTQGNSDQIKVHLYGKVSSQHADSIDLIVDPNQDTLHIGIDTPNGINFGFNIISLDMTVELPQKVWDSLEVNATSGDLEVSEANGKSVEVQTKSGNIVMTHIQADTIKMEASSGNASLQHFEADKVTFDLRSGNVDLEDGVAEIKGEVTSGNIHIAVEDLKHNTELESNSGSVTVELSNQPESLAVDYRGTSGKGTIEWEGIQYEEKSDDRDILKGSFGDGKVKLKVRTTSGDFTLDN